MIRKYKNYKNSGMKLPFIGWLLERRFIFVSFLLILVFVSFVGLSKGYSSYARIIEEPKVDTPYLLINAENTPGYIWGKNFIKTSPLNVNSWEVNKSTNPVPLTFDECYDIDFNPSSVLSLHQGNNNDIETQVQVYSAGQATKAFNELTGQLEKCGKITEKEKYNDSRTAFFHEGFIMTIGDALIIVRSQENIEQLREFYYELAERTLTDSMCVATYVSAPDAARNLYYDLKNYKGLQEKQKITSDINVQGTPSFNNISMKELPGTVPVPESPLPEGFPNEPKRLDQPTLPTKPKILDEFSEKVSYEIADLLGPGCGWDWSGLEQPSYDFDKLENNKNQIIQLKENEIDELALKYIEKQKIWVMKMISSSKEVHEWNVYVQKMKKTMKARQELINARELLQPEWFTFIENHKLWMTFDERKDVATKEYEIEFEQCEADQKDLLDWENEWLEESLRQQRIFNDYLQELEEWEKRQDELNDVETEEPGVDNTSEPTESSPSQTTETPVEDPKPIDPSKDFIDIPEKPAGCEKSPEKPAIIDQEKPDEPQQPTIPENVTIPDSWPKPEKDN